MTIATARTIYKGSVEYVDIEIEADVELGDQAVQFSFDNRASWHGATWQGDAGTTRTAALLVDDTILGPRSREVFVKLTDNPEIPIISAGTIERA